MKKEKRNHSRHGLTGTRFYRVWLNMKNRCLNKKHERYHRYGGRDIIICDNWEKDFKSFMMDMHDEYLETIKTIPNCQLDRKDNNGNYEKDNCHFVSPQENSANSDNTVFTRKLSLAEANEARTMYRYEGLTQKEIAEYFSVSISTIKRILNNKTYMV